VRERRSKFIPSPLAGEGWGEVEMKFAGGCPAASFFLLLAQKKETKEKGTLPRRR
jgi:hypothetical protein